MLDTDNNESTLTKEEAKNDEKSQIYELGFLLLPSISEENIPVVFDNYKELIISFGGDVISGEMPRMIRLAYVMTKIIENKRNKFDSAYFGWVKFEMSPEKLVELKSKLDLSPDLIRFLIIKTVRENTLAPRKYSGNNNRFKNGVEKREEKKDDMPIDEEQVSKEIDALAEAAV
ncbi:MAG: 30S ribosomal protein S6 [Candidatus Paceibacterota bacterium]